MIRILKNILDLNRIPNDDIGCESRFDGERGILAIFATMCLSARSSSVKMNILHQRSKVCGRPSN